MKTPRTFAIKYLSANRWQVTDVERGKIIGVYPARDAAGDLVRRLQALDATRMRQKASL